MYRTMLQACFIWLFAVLSSCGNNDADNKPRRLEILFLGHSSKHHDSEKLADIFSKEYFKDGINISYTTDPGDLNEDSLYGYDGLILYANYDSITASQEKALLGFVKNGKGFIPLHCASFCFRNSPEVVELIGGQFRSHEYDSFPAVLIKAQHPVLKGINAFTTNDETYVHDKLSKNIEVLTERLQGDHHEPYTWVREYGDGRVFYTAYGHDDNTFNNRDFLQLVKNGIMWAVGDRAVARLKALKMPLPTYTDANIPNYEKRDPDPKLQAPLTPEESMLLMQVPVGFELQLFAAEPDIINPIYMNWDARGRLWVIETVDYPNTVRDVKEEGDDRIKILEDTDGDGKADKISIFADKLNIPTSFTFVKDGIIVAQAPNFLLLRDTNADDKADKREILINGWGTFDTHAGPSNLRYGINNKIWGTVGYSGFKGKIGADSMEFSQGLYQFSQDGQALDFLASTSNNTWGLGFSEDFDVFISTANNTHSGFYGIAKKYMDIGNINVSGIEKIDAHYGMHVVTKNLRQVDVFGGFTAAAGHSLYTARNFPREYWNRIAFVNEPTGRLIHRQVLEQEGAGFKETGDGWNMLASADEWMGPIQAEVGPDGNLWILDWYDFIIQHNPTPANFETGKGNAYEITLRDHDRGRIYKIKPEKSTGGKLLSLSQTEPDGLIRALSDKNMFWRTTSQRLIVESGNKKLLPDLYKIVQNEKLDEIGLNAPAIHALWTIHGLHALDGSDQKAIEVSIKALRHPAGGVRRAAIQVLSESPVLETSILDAGVLNDKDLRVRLAAVLAVADKKSSEKIGRALFEMAENKENASDKWLRQAIFISAKAHQDGFMAAFKEKGRSDNTVLADATFSQRIAIASRVKTTPIRQWLRLPAETAPDVRGKELLISASMDIGNERNYSGLVVAQGNQLNGYAVYLLDNKLFFRINQEGKAYTLQTANELPRQFNFKAILLKYGAMSLLVNDQPAVTTVTKGLFTKQLPNGLRTGFENMKEKEKAGPYPDTFRLRNALNNASVELMEPGTAVSSTSNTTALKADKKLILKVVKNVMKYDQEIIKVKAGTVVELVLENPDFMQHNLVIIQPGSIEKVGAAADKLAMDPNGATLNYVPVMPEVLFSTPLINPEGNYTLKFRVPDVVGDYPYVCTFPGHWRMMKGIMQVTR